VLVFCSYFVWFIIDKNQQFFRETDLSEFKLAQSGNGLKQAFAE
jgi:hypothetical protein